MIFSQKLKRSVRLFFYPVLMFSAFCGSDAVLSAKSTEGTQKESAKSHFQEYRKQLAQRLPDLERIDLIVSEYKKLANKAKLSKKMQSGFEKWLSTKLIYVGS